MATRLLLVLASLPWVTEGGTCTGDQSFEFPPPTVTPRKAPLTPEQQWMAEHWPGYQNGVSLGGLFVVENWMFWRHEGADDLANLHLPQQLQFDNHAWSKALLAGDLQTAYSTMDCHLKHFYSDADLDAFAEFGINAVRLPVGYWLFDDPALYPNDPWVHAPEGSSPYGANPDGFITPGTIAVTDLVIRLWNRNMKVVLDMHALPGCSSPHQSYAGIWCEPKAPNTWAGLAEAGISGGHKTKRAADGKTWSDVARKIALERVVPWIKFINRHAPGAIIAYELVNEPDIASTDATVAAVKRLSLDLGKDVLSCLGVLADQVHIGISTAAKNYQPNAVAADYKKPEYNVSRSKYWSDVHHYFYWSGCIDYGAKTFSIQCACESNLPGTSRASEDADWASWMGTDAFNKGWRFYIGEWSAGLGTAHKCHYGMPTEKQARALWQAQKWGYLNQYVYYHGKAFSGQSSFVGDYYWNGRMGYNWNPAPDVCAGSSSITHYKDFKSWDWSLIRLIKLGIAQPLSKLSFSPEKIAAQKATTCTGTLHVLCDSPQPSPLAPSGGQPGMGPAPSPSPAAPPGGQPGMGACSKKGKDCRKTKCCEDPDTKCTWTNKWWAQCGPKDVEVQAARLNSAGAGPLETDSEGLVQRWHLAVGALAASVALVGVVAVAVRVRAPLASAASGAFAGASSADIATGAMEQAQMLFSPLHGEEEPVQQNEA